MKRLLPALGELDFDVVDQGDRSILVVVVVGDVIEVDEV